MLKNPYKMLDDQTLEAKLLENAREERKINVDMILQLVVVRERNLHTPQAYESLFAYCVEKLKFSRSTAYRRKAIVDKAEAFPEILDRLLDGRLHLCTAAVLAPHLKDGSAGELFKAVEGLSHREVEAYLVKSWRAENPAPKKPKEIHLNAETEAPVLKFEAPAEIVAAPPRVVASPTEAAKDVPASLKRTVVRPISATENRVSVSMSDETLDKLRRAKEILARGTDDELLSKALDLLLEKIAPERRNARRQKRAVKKAAAHAKPRSTKQATPTNTRRNQPATHSRRGRLEDRDAIVVEAGCRCTFVGADGKRCTARTFLEVDHDRPWALGGHSTRENLRILCRTHNAYRAEKTFGPWRSEKFQR